MQSSHKAHPLVQSSDGSMTTAEREAAGSFTQADGSYYNPYYDWGSGAMSAIGEALATVNWNEAWGWTIIVVAYLFLSGLSVWAWNPFLISIFVSQGDLKNCLLASGATLTRIQTNCAWTGPRRIRSFRMPRLSATT